MEPTVTHRQGRQFLAILASMLVLFVVGLVGAHLEAVRAARQSTRNFCTVLTALDGGYRTVPPSTPTGKTIATDMHNLVIRLGCTPQKP